VKNFADAMGFSEHAPNFSRYPVKIEIGTGLQTQNDDATIDVGRSQLLVLNKDAIDCDAQRRGAPLFCGDPSGIMHQTLLRCLLAYIRPGDGLAVQARAPPG
jgi:hypothetical protein